MMESRIAAESQKAVEAAAAGAKGAASAASGVGGEPGMGAVVPEFLHHAFSLALGQALLLPGLVAIAGAMVALFFRKGSRKAQ